MSIALISTFRRCGVAALALTLAGCAAAPQAGGSAPAAAHVTVVNLTDYRWQVDIVPQGQTRHFVRQVEPRGSAGLDVPGGSYQIEQTILTQTDVIHPARRFTAQLAAGKTYHWPLATLQSDTADE